MRLALVIIALVATLCTAEAATARDPKQRAAFVKTHPCPATMPHSKRSCPGFVVDHIQALDCGGADRPENMQWQTVAEAKAKDRIERRECKNRTVLGDTP